MLPFTIVATAVLLLVKVSGTFATLLPAVGGKSILVNALEPNAANAIAGVTADAAVIASVVLVDETVAVVVGLVG